MKQLKSGAKVLGCSIEMTKGSFYFSKSELKITNFAFIC